MQTELPRDHPVPIEPHRLQLGVFVMIDHHWLDHPFARNRFLISTASQLRELQAMEGAGLFWIPALSQAEPLPEESAPAPRPARASGPPAEDDGASLRRSQSVRERLLVAQARRDWNRAAETVRHALRGLRDNPQQAASDLSGVATAAAARILGGQDILQLLDRPGAETGQYHALNCMTIATLVAKVMRLPPQQITDVALGALVHDVGKVLIPHRVLREAKRSPAEERVYRDHCQIGLELARGTGVFSETVLDLIRDHHEAVDGSGFPAGRPGAELTVPARILALVNRYDRLCGPESPERTPLRPADALRRLWRDERKRIDPDVFSAMVNVLGVYPPGSIVQLSDLRIALVIAPSARPTLPLVLIYQPSRTQEQANLLDLSAGADGLAVEKHLLPHELSREALQWLDPRERLVYYFRGAEPD